MLPPSRYKTNKYKITRQDRIRWGGKDRYLAWLVPPPDTTSQAVTADKAKKNATPHGRSSSCSQTDACLASACSNIPDIFLTFPSLSLHTFSSNPPVIFLTFPSLPLPMFSSNPPVCHLADRIRHPYQYTRPGARPSNVTTHLFLFPTMKCRKIHASNPVKTHKSTPNHPSKPL